MFNTDLKWQMCEKNIKWEDTTEIRKFEIRLTHPKEIIYRATETLCQIIYMEYETKEVVKSTLVYT